MVNRCRDYSNEELVLYLQALRLRHNLTDIAFEDIIKFIAIITDKLDGPLRSRYLFDKYYNMLTPEEQIKKYIFCVSCYKNYIESEAPVVCCCGIRLVKGDNHFVYSCLKTSIKYFLETAENSSEILRWNARPPSFGNMTDFCDSKRYGEIKQLHKERHGLRHQIENLISFITVFINVDGVEVFNSATKSLYPVMITINEMCPSMRGKNIIIPQFFTATKSTPFHQKIMNIVVKDICDMESNGVDWLDSNGIRQNTKVYVGTLCLDAPVKSKLLGIPSHSSKSGCPLANCQGIWVPKGKSGGVVWPSVTSGLPREDTNHGIESIFSMVPSLSGVLYKATSLDSLHGVYIGVVKYLMNIIFFSTKTEKTIRVARQKVANQILDATIGPFFIERGKARNLQDVANWKAHEFRNFLFFFSVPIMDTMVKTKLIESNVAQHWFNFVLGVSLLNKQEISTYDIRMSADALFLFVHGMGEIYGDDCCTYNVHLLIHLTSSVEYLGPLWSTSMFKFEGYNRTILNSFNGSSSVELQIAKRLGQRRSLNALHNHVRQQEPCSPALEHRLVSDDHSRGVKCGGANEYNAEHIGALKQVYGSILDLKQLRSITDARIGSQKYTTFDHHMSNKRTNQCGCYIFSESTRCFGRICGLYIAPVNEVYVVFEPIISTENNRLPHSIFQCIFSSKINCDLLSRCKAAILVPYRNGETFSMSHQPNRYESS